MGHRDVSGIMHPAVASVRGRRRAPQGVQCVHAMADWTPESHCSFGADAKAHRSTAARKGERVWCSSL